MKLICGFSASSSVVFQRNATLFDFVWHEIRAFCHRKVWLSSQFQAKMLFFGFLQKIASNIVHIKKFISKLALVKQLI